MSMTSRSMPLDDEFQMPQMRLDGRVALITGGSRGLGLGMALALAHAGADVALVSRNPDELEKAANLVRASGREALTLPADLGEISKVHKLVRGAVEHFGRLDILVNAAGINVRQPADEFTERDWDQLMTVNLKSVFFLCQEAARVMRAKGKGKIINMSSMASEITVPNIALYAISKGGIRQMTRALAVEWAKDKINVNALAPGRFWTKLTDAVFSNDERYESAISVIPQGRPGVPSDLAGATVLLASDASDYITGQTIFVDGGWLINGGAKA